MNFLSLIVHFFVALHLCCYPQAMEQYKDHKELFGLSYEDDTLYKLAVEMTCQGLTTKQEGLLLVGFANSTGKIYLRKVAMQCLKVVDDPKYTLPIHPVLKSKAQKAQKMQA